MLRCFIATAFNKNDVDNIYDKIFVPVLKQLSIKPLRVDRVEHNDDIDDTIFLLLDNADFWADLTYARPSVYYEAGYGFGKGKPIIYTARSDHFKDKLNDPEGLKRIHFDLQMKNIIPWSIPNKTFLKKLETRIKKVIRPILIQNIKKQKELTEEIDFSRFSQIERTKIIVSNAKNILKRRGFKTLIPSPGSVSNYKSSSSYKSFNCKKVNNDTEIKINFYCDPIITKKKIEDYLFYFKLRFESSTNKSLTIHTFFCTFRQIPKSRISESLISFNEVLSKSYYQRFFDKSKNSFTDVYCHFIDGIKSKTKFQNGFKDIINNFSSI